MVEDGTAAHPICSCGVFVQQTTKACCMVSVCFPGTQLDLAFSELEKKKKRIYLDVYSHSHNRMVTVMNDLPSLGCQCQLPCSSDTDAVQSGVPYIQP